MKTSECIPCRERGRTAARAGRLFAQVLLLAGMVGAFAAEPVLWTPTAIASEDYESSPAFTPDGREMFFMRADKSFQNYRLLWSRCERGGWSRPVPPPFPAPAPVLEGDPFVTPDGRQLYFISSRHAHQAGRGNEDLDIWVADRLPGGGWSKTPRRLPEPVNSEGSELLPRLTREGVLYFGSSRPGGQGGSDIYMARQEHDEAWTVSAVAELNTPMNEYEAEVSLDGRRLVLVADRGDRSHLYLFGRASVSDRWVEQRRLPALPTVFQVGPALSPSGDRLLFAQSLGRRSGEIFRLDLESHPAPSWPPSCGP
ncbi:hypothetical protein [Roseateles violae]|uniref:WD40 repeat protein n=1 Tax=Roseateles violae TaxID=3058042 RepID=A0ABT8DYM4_9BURK|nr:hypothetical protein [Pelomonas sp. PFR6]MDN3922686.1 hypothetical protein [Pelomonas sp. PFR6]